MRTLIGERPRTQLIASRLLQRGDYIARSDLTFGIVADVMYSEHCDAVTIEFLDGGMWLGDHDTPFPVAMSRQEAAEWNRRRAELDLEGWAALHDFAP